MAVMSVTCPFKLNTVRRNSCSRNNLCYHVELFVATGGHDWQVYIAKITLIVFIYTEIKYYGMIHPGESPD